MLQNIFPHKMQNQYRNDRTPCAGDRVMVFYGKQVLVGIEQGERGGSIDFPRVEELSGEGNLIYLFAVDEEVYFLFMGSSANPKDLLNPSAYVENSYRFADLKELREAQLQPKYRLFAACTGKHLFDWYRDTCFCGRCGERMHHSVTERAMHCDVCGYTAYPRIMPAVIVGVINGDSLLLTKYKTGYNHNALIAGFTEIGETLEETVSREVMEEAGIRVKNIRYYKSQPWGIAGDILAGYYCEVDGDSTIKMDEGELKYAAWVKAEEIELQPDDASLTNEMMKKFQDEHRGFAVID